VQKKNTPNSAAATTSIVASDVARLRLEKIRSGIRGSSWRRSFTTKAAISAAATANPASVPPEVQPQPSALISVNTSAIVPSVIAIAPSASYPPCEACSERLSGTIR
jgi:hypothetical protein